MRGASSRASWGRRSSRGSRARSGASRSAATRARAADMPTPTPAETLAKLSENPLLAPDPALLDWPAPAGVRATAEGLRTTFRTMGFAFACEQLEGGAVEFAATRRPTFVAGVVAALLAAGIAWPMSVANAPLSWIVTAVVLEALVVSLALAPRYAVRGAIR